MHINTRLFLILSIKWAYVYSQTNYYFIDGIGKISLFSNNKYKFYYQKCFSDSGEYSIDGNIIEFRSFFKKHTIEIGSDNKYAQNFPLEVRNKHRDRVVIFDICLNPIYDDTIILKCYQKDTFIIDLPKQFFIQRGYEHYTLNEFLIKVGYFCSNYWISLKLPGEFQYVRIYLFDNMRELITLDKTLFIKKGKYLIPDEITTKMNYNFPLLMKSGKRRKYKLLECEKYVH